MLSESDTRAKLIDPAIHKRSEELLEASIERQLYEINALHQALIRQAFNGEL